MLATNRERTAHERVLEQALAEALTKVGAGDLADAAIHAQVAPLYDPDGETATELAGALTFEDAGMLTGNRGLVVNLTDGSQFHLAIARSRNPRTED